MKKLAIQKFWQIWSKQMLSTLSQINPLKFSNDDEEWFEEEQEPTIEGIGGIEPLYDYAGDDDNNMKATLAERFGISQKDVKEKLKDGEKLQFRIDVYYKGIPCASFHHAFMILDRIKRYGFHYRSNIEDAIIGVFSQDGDYFEYNTEKEPYYIVVKARETTKDKWDTAMKFGERKR